MKAFARVSLLVAVSLVAAGPLLAAPLTLSAGPGWSAPAAPGSPLGSLAKLAALSLAAVGAIRVKDTGTLAKKFVQRASNAAGEYTDGVKNAGADWEANTKAGADNYKQAVVAAANAGRFEKGVAAAGQQKFVARASTLGAQRFPTGVAAAEGAWAQGTQPFLQTIANLTLPPRRPKGDPANQARANMVAQELRKQKLAQ